MSATILCACPFDGRRGDAARRLFAETLVRPHRAVGADDRSAGPNDTALPSRILLRALRWIGRGGQYVPTGTSELVGTGPFVSNPVTSDPVRYARNAAILEEDPTLGLAAPSIAWADTSFRAMHKFKEMKYPSQIRQPVLMLAAGADTIVSTAAIEEFAYHMRAGSHLVIAGAKHELLQEQDRYREQFWAAFDAFVPGTPLFR